MAPTAVALAPQNGGDIIESVIAKGDLSKLDAQERTRYYVEVCKSVGLNPLTKPLEYITLNGKLTLYALRNCTDQLRAIHRVSVVDISETERDGVLIVTCKVSNAEGRTDINTGAVSIANLKGEALSNAIMKAETNAKRRATLSICGLSMLDETEIESIPASAKAPAVAAAPLAPPVPTEPPHHPETGEISPHQIPIGYVETPEGDASDWIGYGRSFIAAVKSAASLKELSAWQDMNQSPLAACAENAPKAYKSICAALDRRRAEFTPKDADIMGEDDPAKVLTAC
jgi:hypothetical protein